jgi:membrane fusion protein, multidrug efflux system
MRLLQRHHLGRRIGIIGGGVVALGIIAIAVGQLDSPGGAAINGSAPTPAAVPVTAAMATRQDVPNIIHTIGTVQSIDTVAVKSQVSGPIVKIEFQPGQNVKKGQELFLIDPRPYQVALDQAKAQLRHDEAVLAEAQRDLTRYQTLANENSIAKQQAQDQAFVVEQDEGTVARDQANVQSAQINLDYCHIKSPIDGRAGILLVEPGNLVSPGIAGQTTNGVTPTTGSATNSAPAETSGQMAASGQTSNGGLVSIAQIKPIYVNFPVAETLFDRVQQGQAAGALKVAAYSQSGKRIVTGRLVVIDNQVNSGTGTVMMEAIFSNNDEALWPGEFVRVELVVSTRRNVVTVPAQAVMVGANGTYVYVISTDQVVHRVGVQVSAQQSGIDVIETGVSASTPLAVCCRKIYRTRRPTEKPIRPNDRS